MIDFYRSAQIVELNGLARLSTYQVLSSTSSSEVTIPIQLDSAALLKNFDTNDPPAAALQADLTSVLNVHHGW